MSQAICTIIAGPNGAGKTTFAQKGQKMSELEKKAEQVLNSLNESVQEALEKKRLLGQYAVVWKDGKVTKILERK